MGPCGFYLYLHSRHNDAFDPSCADDVYQSMDEPLCHYFIASSHNTYLTGNQLTSESSAENYVRALRAGCRCIEIDVWDPPWETGGEPIVTHGFTGCGQIPLRSTMRAVAKHGFSTSDYPIILSIKNHCNVHNQEIMAQIFREELGDLLCDSPIGPNGMNGMLQSLPSPEELKKKIILKDQKGNHIQHRARSASRREDDPPDEDEVEERVYIGNLYIKAPPDVPAFTRFFAVLTPDSLMLYGETIPNAEATQPLFVEDLTDSMTGTVGEEEGPDDHLDKEWYYPHETADGARRKLEDVGRDGCFLVRQREDEGCALCVWVGGRAKKLSIESDENGCFVVAGQCFATIPLMVQHYQQTRLHLKDEGRSTFLTEPIRLIPNIRETGHLYAKYDWFNGPIDSETVDSQLQPIPADESFLVRSGPGFFEIAYKSGPTVQRKRLVFNGHFYRVSDHTKRFVSVRDQPLRQAPD